MEHSWQHQHWGDIATLEYGKGLRDYKSGAGLYPVFGTNGPIGFHSDALCPYPGVIIGRKGVYRGVVYSDRPFYVIDTAFYVKPKIEIDMRWAYYELLTHDINGLDSGSAIPSTSRESFYSLPVFVPPLEEQRAIAAVLGVLDDKIELNRRMNATLEVMARALFKSWFVDFDPVRAKMEGRTPYGMNAATAALFPAAFTNSSLGPIPQGWEVAPFSETITLFGGGTPKTSITGFWNGGIPWFSVGDAPTDSDVFVTQTEKTITEAGLANSSARVLPANTAIISARGTVGKCALLGCPMAMNQSCYGIRSTEGRGDYFTYYALRAIVSILQRNTHGAVFDTITRSTFHSVQTIVPPTELTRAFDEDVAPYLGRILSNLKESRVLAAIRDALLPKLLSGAVRIRDAMRAAETTSLVRREMVTHE